MPKEEASPRASETENGAKEADLELPLLLRPCDALPGGEEALRYQARLRGLASVRVLQRASPGWLAAEIRRYDEKWSPTWEASALAAHVRVDRLLQAADLRVEGAAAAPREALVDDVEAAQAARHGEHAGDQPSRTAPITQYDPQASSLRWHQGSIRRLVLPRFCHSLVLCDVKAMGGRDRGWWCCRNLCH